ncbi:hypothetical protein V494_00337, partial [Pseudogymnoascus sp. VKM F-4513 (FW-928)]
MDDSFVKVGGSPEEVRTYRAHVSSKYLELTRKKLEVTRLPHDLTLEKGQEWQMGTPKSIIEPLVDYWLETYDWRGQEQLFNDTLPQFRVSIHPPGAVNKKPLRIHFIHIKSPLRNAIPLLVLPSFPFTNLSFSPLFAALHSPADGGQAYDIVVPSIPGLGFSDPFNTSPNDPLLASTAYIFNRLMSILGYEQYLATGTGSAAASPANIDYHLPRLIGERYRSNCLGIHIIDPAVLSPSPTGAPLSYLKYSFAKFFHASIFGYTAADWAASGRRPSEQAGIAPPSPAELEATTVTEPSDNDPPKRPGIDRQATGPSLFKRPVFSTTDEATRLSNGHLSGDLTLTLAYALCDSPTGMLSLALLGLERICPDHTLTKAEITTILQLAWLPGPEAALRLWSGADAEVRKEAAERTAPSGGGCPISITAYEGALGDSGSFRSPVWAESRHRVVHIQRREGQPGLPWDNAEDIMSGVRELSKAVWKHDGKGGDLQEAMSYMEGREKQAGFFDAGEELDALDAALQRPQMSERDMGSSDTVVPQAWTPEGGLSGGGTLGERPGSRLETEDEYLTDQELAGTWKGDSKGKGAEEVVEQSEKSKGKQKEGEKAVKRKKGRRLQRRMGVEASPRAALARPSPLLIQPLAVQPNARLPSAAGARRPWLAASDSTKWTRATVAVSPVVTEGLVQQRARVRVVRATSAVFAWGTVYGASATAQRAA